MSAPVDPENSQPEGAKRPPINRRRDKPQLSCMSCRQRKLRCDRNRPCENCTKRSLLCVYPNWASSNAYDQKLRQASRSTPRVLQDRLQHLEELVTSLVSDRANANSLSPNVVAADPARQTEEVADSFGRLVVDEYGTNYVGSSHWQTILDELADVKEILETSARPPLEESPSESSQAADNGIELFLGVNQNISREEILNTIPSKPTVDYLITRFFQSMELGTCTLSRPLIKRYRYELFWQDPSSTDIMWIGLLFGMMGLGSYFYLLDGMSQESAEKTEAALKLYRKRCTQCLILGNYTKPQPAVLNTLLVYFMVEFVPCQDMEFGLCLLVGTIVHLALRMGYHRDPSHYPHISVFEGEMRRRTWAVISHLDLMMPVQFGIQRFTNEKLTDTTLPRNLMNDDFDENTTELPPPRPKTELTHVSYTNARTMLLQVLGNIIESIESTRQASHDTIMKEDRKLNQLFESLPPQFKMPKGTIIELPTSIFQRVVLELLYNKARCLLHKKHFALPDTAYAYSRRTCLDAAMRILKIQSFLHNEAQPGGRFYDQRWKLSLILRQDFMLAAMIICVNLEHQSVEPQPALPTPASGDYPYWRAEDKIRALEYAYEAWEKWLRASKDEARAAEAVKIVLDKHRKANQGEPIVESDDITKVHPSSTLPAPNAGMSQGLSMTDSSHSTEMLYYPVEYLQKLDNEPSGCLLAEYRYTLQDTATSYPANPFTAQTTTLPQFGNHSVDAQRGMEFSAPSDVFITEPIAPEPPMTEWVRLDGPNPVRYK
ncbi:hypothetical protein AJ78_05510 [Emergomyces pasteurianus Ep9510]|uniref:C6 finger domain transcription factor nscR n=1 Tax=Emergomyces pasteurianus Ep9510 TaxID=1447872 RepID=A0A1J9PDM3_9EURO|nr:hypothetical protein AJ78_05510 [Emergomyces pasteurianus Ep9510]